MNIKIGDIVNFKTRIFYPRFGRVITIVNITDSVDITNLGVKYEVEIIDDKDGEYRNCVIIKKEDITDIWRAL